MLPLSLPHQHGRGRAHGAAVLANLAGQPLHARLPAGRLVVEPVQKDDGRLELRARGGGDLGAVRGDLGVAGVRKGDDGAQRLACIEGNEKCSTGNERRMKNAVVPNAQNDMSVGWGLLHLSKGK